MFLYLNEEVSLFYFLTLSVALSALILGASFFLSIQNESTSKLSSYECGFDPFEDARNVFDVHFYLVAILFLVLDLEVLFLFPWAVSLSYIGLKGFIGMSLFLFILTVGFFYEWKLGALEWFSAKSAAKHYSTVMSAFGALPDGVTNSQILGIVGGIAVAVAFGAGYRHFSSEFHATKKVHGDMIQQKDELNLIYENSIKKVESLVEASKSADISLSNFQLIKRACGPEFSRPAYEQHGFELNRWASIRSRRIETELHETKAKAKEEVLAAQIEYDDFWVQLSNETQNLLAWEEGQGILFHFLNSFYGGCV
jgi:NADH-quinone oxidoreductase subunit A